jgi:hypothetical protein
MTIRANKLSPQPAATRNIVSLPFNLFLTPTFVVVVFSAQKKFFLQKPFCFVLTFRLTNKILFSTAPLTERRRCDKPPSDTCPKKSRCLCKGMFDTDVTQMFVVPAAPLTNLTFMFAVSKAYINNNWVDCHFAKCRSAYCRSTQKD